ncbi:hypothetical protein DICPUDRAFT_55507 [Dictyostelium purpureum]|uniref:Chitin-binding type-4 domain-containing protein n=1 Tax=Dictyostelium purpureum TaxID=5786 RepID=F0ZMF0_DICPU|nr:uncharacterized protein DICPUDRAFT_55507 [Dictyostelium purpureum]EGC34905.1 hypothetical protein DICPUDRAFT_55507 [Dictyostelium purpureum]|eukprot:XP_003288597.1 hypothetical protein DICPUDRAFT_55507 [Dictyostelium purpureum]
MKLLLLITILFYCVCSVYSHGYTVSPVARQRKCTSNPKNSIWWPEDGSGIVDAPCRAAYEHVYEKNNKQSEAVIQFTQENEYAVMIPNFDEGFTALKAAVPNHICSAHAINPNAAFGDKSGMSIKFAWDGYATEVDYDSKTHMSTLEIDFCATAIHNPSYWEFYLTKNNFNVEEDEVSWDNLDLVATYGNVLPSTTTSSICISSSSYKMTISIPYREGKSSVLVVRWQRDDPAGECFINCSDIIFKKGEKKSKKSKKN